MPLSAPQPREHIHTRAVTCCGYRRADGLWDIEGHLRDTKTYPFSSLDRGTVAPGEPVHDMWLRLTVDDRLIVQAVEAVTEHGPFSICGNITPNYQRLVGLSISHGWTRKTRELLGGIQGCTHLLELLGPIATTAFQTVYPWLQRQKQLAGEPTDGDDGEPPVLLNSCHAFASNSPVVERRWPQFYTGNKAADERS